VTCQLTAVDELKRTALHYCTTNRRSTIVDLLLRRWIETGSRASCLLEMSDSDGLTALAYSVVAGNWTIVKHLLIMGADVSCHDNERHTLMHFAAGNTHTQLISDN